MRSMWKGSLGWGMVAIPVKLYGATDDKKISMHQLHTECHSRIKMPRYCSQCDRQVETSEIVKGYEISKDKYVEVTESDLDTLPLNSLKSIQIDAFVEKVGDLRYYKDCYFLSPEEVGVKAFVLFVKAMEDAGVVGISKISIREREQLCCVRPFEGILLLQTLHWTDEFRDYGELIPFATITDAELEMAGKLVGAMTKEVSLENYKDSYREALIELINAKLEGRTIEAAPAPPKQDADLAKQLLASLNAITAK